MTDPEFYFTQNLRIPDHSQEFNDRPFENNLFLYCCHAMIDRLNERPAASFIAFEIADYNNRLITVSSNDQKAAVEAAVLIKRLTYFYRDDRLDDTLPETLIAEQAALKENFARVCADAKSERYYDWIYFKDNLTDFTRGQKTSLANLKALLLPFGVTVRNSDKHEHSIELSAKRDADLKLGWRLAKWAAGQINNENEVGKKGLGGCLARISVSSQVSSKVPVYFQRRYEPTAA